jgi:hypothetical protein
MIRVTTSRTVRWTRHAARMGKMRSEEVVITLTWRQVIFWETTQNQETLGHLVEYVVLITLADYQVTKLECLLLGLWCIKQGCLMRSGGCTYHYVYRSEILDFNHNIIVCFIRFLTINNDHFPWRRCSVGPHPVIVGESYPQVSSQGSRILLSFRRTESITKITTANFSIWYIWGLIYPRAAESSGPFLRHWWFP